jgi:periplasmic divalent cation tolerance protein
MENNKGHDSSAVKSALVGTLPADCVAALLYTTFPTREGAIAAARRLVEEGLAGCVNILPAMTSVYVWEGATEVADEVVMIVKVPPDRMQLAADAVRCQHPYETPALLVLPVVAGGGDYLAWLRAGTRSLS